MVEIYFDKHMMEDRNEFEKKLITFQDVIIIIPDSFIVQEFNYLNDNRMF